MALRAPTSFMDSVMIDDEDFLGGSDDDVSSSDTGDLAVVPTTSIAAAAAAAEDDDDAPISLTINRRQDEQRVQVVRAREDVLDRVSARLPEDELSAPAALGQPPAPHSGAVALGPQAIDFRIDGLDMRVPNPRFEAAQELYNAATRRLRVRQIAADQARRWVLDSERTQTVVYAQSTGARLRLDSIEQDIRDVLLNAS